MCSVSAGDSAEAPIWLARLSQSVIGNHYDFEAVLDAVRRIEFSDLPKAISGKIRRVQLRNVEAERRQKNEKQEWEFFEEDFPELKA